MGIAESTEFKSVILPPKDRSDPFQDCNLCSIFVINGCHSEKFSFFQCSGTPKYVMGRDDSWQPS